MQSHPYPSCKVHFHSIYKVKLPCYSFIGISYLNNHAGNEIEVKTTGRLMLMGTKQSPAALVRKPILTPKSIIFQKYGSKACYRVEEEEESTETGCPGLTISQKGPCLYRCSLHLPEISVVSGAFRRKKDAEQSAAEMALEKLGIHPTSNGSEPTPQEAWENLVDRLKFLFKDEFLSLIHPLSGHFRAALCREGDHNGSVPVSVISVYDAKLYSLCKVFDPEVDSNPLLVILHIMRAAAKLPDFLAVPEGRLSLCRLHPYPPEIRESSNTEQSSSPERLKIEAVCVPCSNEKLVEAVTLHISSYEYYLDVIAEKLGLGDAAKVMVSRNVGKASSETRLYFAAPEPFLLNLTSNMLNSRKPLHFDKSLNMRASYLSGQDIFGDAILASIAYTWKSKDLVYEDITVRSYYRMLLGKTPSGIYKLSREAVVASELPLAFTLRTNWRGSFPREILSIFCRQHRLAEPVYSTISIPLKAYPESSGSVAKETKNHDGGTLRPSAEQVEECTYRCVVELFSKRQDLLLKCSPEDAYKKQNDATQNASLKLIQWLNKYLKDPDVPLEILSQTAGIFNIQVYPQNFLKEFALCQLGHHIQLTESKLLESFWMNMPYTTLGNEVCNLKIEGPDSGVYPCNGSLSCISYSLSLVTKDEHTEQLERCEDFEFEIGVGAVISHMESVVMQMSVGRSSCFSAHLPATELIFASASDSAQTLLLSSNPCRLEYLIALTRVTEPLEDRMEKALFSPPLSKQRVEYAVQHIKESCATTLVDFGCGSGSLLDSLLNYPTSLERIVGVDISKKSLSRAAKVLHSKLGTDSDANVPYSAIKSITLYDGSITDFDSRICGFDIGTCLEVIEHMEEDHAHLFGDIVLSSFRPKVLIVSTPNFEYNTVLRRSGQQKQEEEQDEKTQLQSCKFRNHDHKFEWTREQFNGWASALAARHNFSVDFSGVGGSADVEPGFASQIALFRRGSIPDGDFKMDCITDHPYEVIWEWHKSKGSTAL